MRKRWLFYFIPFLFISNLYADTFTPLPVGLTQPTTGAIDIKKSWAQKLNENFQAISTNTNATILTANNSNYATITPAGIMQGGLGSKVVYSTNIADNTILGSNISSATTISVASMTVYGTITSSTGFFGGSSTFSAVNVNSNMIVSGNVGIGTTGPTSPLHVSAGSANPALLVNQTNAAGDAGVLQSAGTNIFQFTYSGSGATSNGVFRVLNAGAATAHIQGTGASYINGGNVGIGTTGPGSKLHVFSAAGTATSPQMIVATGTTNLLEVNGSSIVTNVPLYTSGGSSTFTALNVNGIGGATFSSMTAFGTITSSSGFRGGSSTFSAVIVQTTITLPNSGATAGTYTNTNLTINAAGLVVAAANGTGGGGGGGGTTFTTHTITLQGSGDAFISTTNFNTQNIGWVNDPFSTWTVIQAWAFCTAPSTIATTFSVKYSTGGTEPNGVFKELHSSSFTILPKSDQNSLGSYSAPVVPNNVTTFNARDCLSLWTPFTASSGTATSGVWGVKIQAWKQP